LELTWRLVAGLEQPPPLDARVTELIRERFREDRVHQLRLLISAPTGHPKHHGSAVAATAILAKVFGLNFLPHAR
jgi:hypothetical protein